MAGDGEAGVPARGLKGVDVTARQDLVVLAGAADFPFCLEAAASAAGCRPYRHYRRLPAALEEQRQLSR